MDERSTVYFDEGGMADTRRLDALSEVVERSGGKLVVIGDARQLPAIGAGGLFEELSADRADRATLGGASHR